VGDSERIRQVDVAEARLLPGRLVELGDQAQGGGGLGPTLLDQGGDYERRRKNLRVPDCPCARQEVARQGPCLNRLPSLSQDTRLVRERDHAHLASRVSFVPADQIFRGRKQLVPPAEVVERPETLGLYPSRLERDTAPPAEVDAGAIQVEGGAGPSVVQTMSARFP
jgi:hypothetical protein